MGVSLYRVVVAVSAIIVFSHSSAAAQAQRTGRVQVTVTDPSGGVLPGASVTLSGTEDATRVGGERQATSAENGIALFEAVIPGRYSASAVFPGFERIVVRELRARAGADTRQTIVLPLKNLEDTVVVGRDDSEAASDRRTTEFGVKLSEDQIAALSDDPAELARQLQELAGPEAVFRIDSFEGQQLPPKAQIKSVRVTRDQFAAEAANPGSTFVDIITQPGVGPLRGSANLSLRDGSMTGKSQFADRRGPEQTRNGGMNIGGTLIGGRTSFNASFNGQSEYTTPILYAKLPAGLTARTLDVRAPRRSLNANVLVDHSVTRNQVLRLGMSMNQNKRANIGVGNYNLPERGFSQEETVFGVRAQQAGPIGRRAFLNTRLSVNRLRLDMHSVTEAPTIIVQDAFTAGGAQQEQFAHAAESTLASDLDYVRGLHAFRMGLQLDGTWFSATSRFNYHGTYTFANEADYQAGRPLLYTRSLGNPVNDYWIVRGAVYFQDDIRLRKGLTISPGIRYTQQSRVGDKSAVAPRFGFTWAPFENGRTTIRGSAGLFHGFLGPLMIEQTLRLNGERQREIYISNPSYPDPGAVEELSIPTNKYVIGDFNLQRNLRYSAGLDQVLSPRVRVNALYNFIHLQQQPRGRNVNPLVNGVRADPRFANVIEAVTDAEVRRHELSVNAIVNLAPPGPGTAAAFFNWRRLTFNAGYAVVRARNNAEGPWGVPQTGDIDDDWGPGPADQPYRVQLLLTSSQVRNVMINLNYSTSSGPVYTQTTGYDDNGDGFVTDRPAGVGLRSLRGARQAGINLRAQYNVPISAATPGAQPRYRMNVFVAVQNLTNRQNLGGYSGVMTSPFYKQPTLSSSPRRVDIGMGMNF